jgi:hypothetical protein
MTASVWLVVRQKHWERPGHWYCVDHRKPIGSVGVVHGPRGGLEIIDLERPRPPWLILLPCWQGGHARFSPRLVVAFVPPATPAGGLPGGETGRQS